MRQTEITAYKLFRMRKDGSLGPLFIDRRLVVPTNKWVKAKAVPTKGFAFRPGFHCCAKPKAPHLKMTEERVWCRVKIKGYTEYTRPEAQGGLWFTAKHLKVTQIMRQKHGKA